MTTPALASGALHAAGLIGRKTERGARRSVRRMNEQIRQKILALLDQHRIMTIATLRPDGWPQATTVGYANDGLTLYFLCGPDSQKAANLARDDRVSLTIDHDTPQVMDITGLSMAAHAQAVVDLAEGEKVLRMLMQKYPQQDSAAADAEPGGCPHIPRDADRHLRARLLQGLRTHRSRHLLRVPGLAPGTSANRKFLRGRVQGIPRMRPISARYSASLHTSPDALPAACSMVRRIACKLSLPESSLRQFLWHAAC